MNYYLAPLEGITGYIYRNAQLKHFGHIDKYFTPFISPNQTRKLTSRELHDVLPEHNRGMYVVPQILTNHAEDFIWAARKLQDLGYSEVNLNLGCPSKTVVTKKRGAGFLESATKLQAFLHQVSQVMEQEHMDFSIKTRIGIWEPEEFQYLLPVFNEIPLKELIIHPRLQTDYYRNHPNLDMFALGLEKSSYPVCYNGDLFSADYYERFHAMFPSVETVMLGRGAIAYPGLSGILKTGEPMDKQRLKAFHQTVLDGYREVIPGDKNVLFKMKELWFYMAEIFEDAEKPVKKIKKATRMEEYTAVVEALFGESNLIDTPRFSGWKK